MPDLDRIAAILDGKLDEPTPSGAAARKKPELRAATSPESALGADPLDEIDALLGDGADPGGGDDEPASQKAPAAVGSLDSLKALAEQLKVDPKELYKLKIPMGGDGDATMTLGELKDLGKRSHDVDAAQIAFDEAVSLRRTELAAARDELANLAAMLPRELMSPQMVAKAQEAGERYRAQQGQLLSELVPEWRDAAEYAADRKEILSHVQSSGWTAADLDALQDARLLAYFRKQAKREARINKLLIGLKANPSRRGFKANAKGKEAADVARVQRVAASGSREQKTNAIEQILKGAI